MARVLAPGGVIGMTFEQKRVAGGRVRALKKTKAALLRAQNERKKLEKRAIALEQDLFALSRQTC